MYKNDGQFFEERGGTERGGGPESSIQVSLTRLRNTGRKATSTRTKRLTKLVTAGRRTDQILILIVGQRRTVLGDAKGKKK